MNTSANPQRKRQRSYVPTTALAQSITFADDMMHVAMTDGRVLSVPIIWFPALHKAKPEQLAKYEIGAGGRSLHWPDLDEDLSMAGLMAGVDLESA
jgi:hypothetical protein